METINQFNWPEVAAIAGAAIVILMALITALLSILLKRSGQSKDNGNGVIVQVKEIQHSIETKMGSIESKIDQEIQDRKEDFESIRNCVERGRAERREDINLIHKKLDTGLDKCVKDFGKYCERNQMKCVAVQHAERNANKQKIESVSRLIEHLSHAQRKKWEQQEKFNLRFLAKAKDARI